MNKASLLIIFVMSFWTCKAYSNIANKELNNNPINKISCSDFKIFIECFDQINKAGFSYSNYLFEPYFKNQIDTALAIRYLIAPDKGAEIISSFTAGYAMFFENYIIVISSARIFSSSGSVQHSIQLHSYRYSGILIDKIENLFFHENDPNSEVVIPYSSELFLEYDVDQLYQIEFMEERTFGTDLEIKNNYAPSEQAQNIIIRFDNKGNLMVQYIN